MELRPLAPADLMLLADIDGTVESAEYLHVGLTGEGADVRFAVEPRPARQKTVEPNPIGDDLSFDLKQVANGIEDGLAVVAEHEGLPVGLLLARPVPARRVVELVDLRVDYDHRREGLGSAMVFRLITYAREREARAVRAEVPSGNGPFNRLLDKLGFDLAGLDTRRDSNHDLVKERATLVRYLALD